MAGFNFAQIRSKLALTKRVLPIVLAKQAENHFVESFAKGGQDEYKWAEVQRRIPSTKAWKYRSKPKASSRTSPIGVRTGNLRRKQSRAIREVSWGRIRIVNDTPYADYFYNGTANMPPRQNMKQTSTLTTMQRTTIENEVDKIWNV